jgi:transposase
MRKKYPSDISRKQFGLILADLESARKKTKPRTIDSYDVFCAVLYVLKSGCQWRMLPSDFPKWENVYRHFSTWKETKTLEKVLKKISWRGPTKQFTEMGYQFPHS